jgi:flagellar biosynthetic protein FliQ
LKNIALAVYLQLTNIRRFGILSSARTRNYTLDGADVFSVYHTDDRCGSLGSAPNAGIDSRSAMGRLVMTADDVVFLGRDAMIVTLLLSAPMLVTGLVVGLVISVFQSVTQIQEITLSFIPKILAVFLAFVLFLPWMIGLTMGYVQPLFGDFHSFIH